MVLAPLTFALGCSDDPHAALNAEWQQVMHCSAYFALRASAARESRTAAAGRTAAGTQADAALASRHSYELAALAGRTPADADTRSREIANELWDAIDADLANIGRLRTRYEEPCRTMLGEAPARAEHWRRELRRQASRPELPGTSMNS